jgi:uncharacterized membrane protein YhhN
MVDHVALRTLVAVGITLAVGAAVAGLLREDFRQRPERARLFKTAASLGFVILAVVLGALSAGRAGTCIVLGLVACAAGDVALTFPGERPFLVGLVLFLGGHVAYVFAANSLAPLSMWPSYWSLVPVVVSLASLAWLWRHLGSLRVPVIAYVAAITLMVAGAMAVLRLRGEAAWPFTLGALCFYASDLSVARDRFVSRGFVNRAWGLPAYYLGQVLIAWSLV